MPHDDIDPVHPRSRRRRSRDALIVVLVAALVLLVAQGRGLRSAGEELQPGVERTVLLAVGEPAAWVADRLPFADAAEDATAFLDPEDTSGSQFAEAGAKVAGAPDGAAITPDAFDPVALGEKPRPPRDLRSLLVTGDSLSQPLDDQLARRLAERGIRTTRDPHIGTGLSKSDLLDWNELSLEQAGRAPDAVVVFIGANEGFPLVDASGREVECCGPAWAAEYAMRARRMMAAYRQDGTARVYWLKIPAPRDPERAAIIRSVNAAIDVAAVAYRAQVRVLDMPAIFTPGGRYRDAMEVDGRERLVRENDGVHLTDEGTEIAADVVEAAIERDFEAPGR